MSHSIPSSVILSARDILRTAGSLDNYVFKDIGVKPSNDLTRVTARTSASELSDDLPRQMVDVLRDRFVTGDELLNIPEPEPLVNGLLFAETTSMIIGPPKQGKTFLAVDLVCSLITGSDWLGLPTYGEGRPVIYLAGEGRRGVMKRVKAWCTYYETDLNLITEKLWVLNGGLSLQDDRHRGGLMDLIEEMTDTAGAPCLVVVDTLHRHARGAEENSSKDMGKVIEALDLIAERTHAHVAVVHHTGKDPGKGARGSSALLGAVDTELTVSGDPSGSGSGVVKVTAQRETDPLPPLFVKYEKAGRDEMGAHLSLVAVTTATPPPTDSVKAAAIVEVLSSIETEAGETLTDWHAASVESLGDEGLSKPSFKRMVKTLADGGQVENVSTGKTFRWRVTPTGPLTLDLND